MKSQYWADQVAERLIKSRKKKSFTVASGITPSGTLHFGNFREIITTDIVARALKDAGAKVRFIYSWDDYDRFRKVPANMPKKSILRKHLERPVIEVPNVFGTKYKSYAHHLEAELENSVKLAGIHPEFINQGIMYPKRAYIKEIKTALQKRKEIAAILDKYRKDPLAQDWYPATVYDSETGKDNTKIIDYDGNYTVTYKGSKGKTKTLDFRKGGNIKLRWKADWPMRWAYEKVDFEPGGKDHSTYGSSYTVGQEIVKLFGWIAPDYIMYDFINMKGRLGKMSSSKGNAQSLGEVLNFYIPELARYTFAGRTPRTEIFYQMDEGIIKHYEDFYFTERVAFGKEEVNDKERIQNKRIYRMSVVDKVPRTMPVQPSFKHCVELMNIYQGNVKTALKHLNLKRKIDKERYTQVLTCAWNWINEFATERYVFKINSKTPRIKLASKQKSAIKDLTKTLSRNLNEKQLFKEFGRITKENEIGAKEFFQPIYKILINKTAGPRLAPFILAIGRTKVKKLLTI